MLHFSGVVASAHSGNDIVYLQEGEGETGAESGADQPSSAQHSFYSSNFDSGIFDRDDQEEEDREEDRDANDEAKESGVEKLRRVRRPSVSGEVYSREGENYAVAERDAEGRGRGDSEFPSSDRGGVREPEMTSSAGDVSMNASKLL
jgi:hypothetical protein